MNICNPVIPKDWSFSCENFTYNDHDRSQGYIKRKIVAIPNAFFTGVLLSISHLVKAIIFGIPKACRGDLNPLRKNVYSLIQDLKEALGWIIILFNDERGLYLVQQSLNEKCENKKTLNNPVDTSSGCNSEIEKRVDVCEIEKEKRVDTCEVEKEKRVDTCEVEKEKRVDTCEVEKEEGCKLKKSSFKIEKPITELSIVELHKALDLPPEELESLPLELLSDDQIQELDVALLSQEQIEAMLNHLSPKQLQIIFNKIPLRMRYLISYELLIKMNFKLINDSEYLRNRFPVNPKEIFIKDVREIFQWMPIKNQEVVMQSYSAKEQDRFKKNYKPKEKTKLHC